jgi:hypothetical protein
MRVNRAKPVEGLMKRLLILTAFGLATSPLAFALDQTKTLTIEGPVEVVAGAPSDSSTTYIVQSPDQSRYQIVLPPSERDRLALAIKESPSAVIRFNGKVVEESGSPTLNVDRWERVTTTTQKITTSGAPSRETTVETEVEQDE